LFLLIPNQACLARNPLLYQLKSVYPFDGYHISVCLHYVADISLSITDGGDDD